MCTQCICALLLVQMHWATLPLPFFLHPSLSQGKISREDVAELCCALLSQPRALGCTFEIKCERQGGREGGGGGTSL